MVADAQRDIVCSLHDVAITQQNPAHDVFFTSDALISQNGSNDSRISHKYPIAPPNLPLAIFLNFPQLRILHEGVVGELTVGNVKGVDQHGPQFVKASWSVSAAVQQLSVERVEGCCFVFDPKFFLYVAPGRSDHCCSVAGEAIAASTAARICSVSPGGIRRPVSPSTTNSSNAPTVVAITGTPHAIASSGVSPKPSQRCGATNRSSA